MSIYEVKDFDFIVEFGTEEFIAVHVQDSLLEAIQLMIKQHGRIFVKMNWFDPGVVLFLSTNQEIPKIQHIEGEN